jgi:hypothetical protein
MQQANPQLKERYVPENELAKQQTVNASSGVRIPPNKQTHGSGQEGKA